MRRAAVVVLALALLLGLLLAALVPLSATRPASDNGLVRVEQVDSSRYPELSLFVSVLDAAGSPRAGLSSDDFVVTEDGQPVEIAAFEGGGDAGPIAAALVIDRSGSMDDDDKIDGARAAAAAFVELLRPGDRAAIIPFDRHVNASRGFLSDQDVLRREIDQLEAEGGTALYDAVVAGVDALGEQPGRRVLLVLTDGEDTDSDASLEEAIAYAETAGQPVYVVGLGGQGVSVFGAQLFADIDEEVLQQIAESTGGRYFYAPEAGELAELYAGVAGAVQQEYRLTYVSPRPSYDGTRRDIEVLVGGASAGTGYTERHLINVVSSPLVGLVLLVPLAGLLLLPELRRRRGQAPAPAGPSLAGQPPAPAAALPAAPPTIVAVAAAAAPATIVAPPPQAAGQRHCASCDAPLRPGARFCARCGASQPVAPAPAPAAERRSFCDMCGRPLLPGSRFCTACGEPAARREGAR